MIDQGGNRDHILAEATRLFSERGYEAVGIMEICETCGLTKPTLYHWFGSKRGLLDALVAERGGPFLAAVVAASRYEGRDKVQSGLERIAFAFSRFALADPLFYRLRLAMSFSPPGSEPGDAASALNAALFGAVEAFFKAAAADHGNMKGRHRAFAATFIGTLDTYVGFKLAGQAELDERTIKEALRQFQHGLYS